MKQLLIKGVIQSSQDTACQKDVMDLRGKCVILQFSNPVTINLSLLEYHEANRIEYKSHIERTQKSQSLTYFRYNNEMYSQGEDESIYLSTFGIHNEVTLIALYICEMKEILMMDMVNDFIYDAPIQLKLIWNLS